MDLSNYKIKYREQFQFFRVSEHYVSYLKNFDSNVCDNYHERRTHIGIVIEINNKLYVAPLTSRGKEYLIKNKKYRRTVFLIEEGNLGFIRLGNMIPVPESELSLIIISELEDSRYKDLLLEQYIFLRKSKNRDKIREQANKLYSKRYYNDDFFLADIMCDFKKLETAYDNWKVNHT